MMTKIYLFLSLSWFYCLGLYNAANGFAVPRANVILKTANAHRHTALQLAKNDLDNSGTKAGDKDFKKKNNRKIKDEAPATAVADKQAAKKGSKKKNNKTKDEPAPATVVADKKAVKKDSKQREKKSKDEPAPTAVEGKRKPNKPSAATAPAVDTRTNSSGGAGPLVFAAAGFGGFAVIRSQLEKTKEERELAQSGKRIPIKTKPVKATRPVKAEPAPKKSALSSGARATTASRRRGQPAPTEIVLSSGSRATTASRRRRRPAPTKIVPSSSSRATTASRRRRRALSNTPSSPSSIVIAILVELLKRGAVVVVPVGVGLAFAVSVAFSPGPAPPFEYTQAPKLPPTTTEKVVDAKVEKPKQEPEVKVPEKVVDAKVEKPKQETKAKVPEKVVNAKAEEPKQEPKVKVPEKVVNAKAEEPKQEPAVRAPKPDAPKVKSISTPLTKSKSESNKQEEPQITDVAVEGKSAPVEPLQIPIAALAGVVALPLLALALPRGSNVEEKNAGTIGAILSAEEETEEAGDRRFVGVAVRRDGSIRRLDGVTSEDNSVDEEADDASSVDEEANDAS